MTKCRLIIHMHCRQNVVKSYRLTYEHAPMLDTPLNEVRSQNHWSISAKTLGDVVEHFAPRTDELDWFLQDGKMTFTSYREKVQSGKGTYVTSTLISSSSQLAGSDSQATNAYICGTRKERF